MSSTNSVRLSLVHLQSPVLFLQAENEMNVLLKDSKRSVDYPSAVFYEYASYLGSLDTLHSLVDVIFLWDPLDTNHLLVVDWIRQVLEQGWPIRIGIALVPSSSTSHGLYHNGVDWDSYVKDTTSHIWYHLASNDFPNEDRKNGTLEEEEAMAEMILIALEYLTTQVPCPIAAYYFLAKWKQQVTVPMDIFTLLSGGRTMAAYEELQWIHLERAFLFAYSHGFSCTSSNHPNYQQVETETAPREIWNQWLLHNSTASIRVKQHRQWANAIGLSHLPMVVVNGIPLSDITSQLVTTLEQEMKNILQSRLPNKWVPRLNPALQGQGIAPYNPITLKEILQHPEYYHCKYFQTIAAAENSKTLATIWIAVDLDSMQGLKLVALALEWLSSPLSVPARIAFLSSSPTIGHSSNQTSRWELLLSMKQLVKNKMQGQDTKNHTPPIEFLSYIPTISDQWIRDYPVFMNGFGYPSHLFTFPTDFDMCCFIHSEYIGV